MQDTQPKERTTEWFYLKHSINSLYWKLKMYISKSKANTHRKNITENNNLKFKNGTLVFFCKIVYINRDINCAIKPVIEVQIFSKCRFHGIR